MTECNLCQTHREAIESGACEMNQEGCAYQNCMGHYILLEVRKIIGAKPNDGISILDHLKRLMKEVENEN